MTKGEMKVSFTTVEGTTVTPWFRIFQGTGPNGPFHQRTPIPARLEIKPGPKPPKGRIVKQSRGPLQGGEGAVSIDNVVKITDVESFIDVHRVLTVKEPTAQRYVAGRRVVHLKATPRYGDFFQYDIYIDEDRKFILGLEERDLKGRMLHSAVYDSIQYLSSNALTGLKLPPPLGLKKTLSPAEAASILSLDASRVFPMAAPKGFPHHEIVKTGALETVSLRFSNGTSTGVILVFLRKANFEDLHIKPDPPSQQVATQRQVRDLILSGQAFVDGPFIGVTHRIEHLSCVELHTSSKSILVLSPAGLDVAKELVSNFPLP